METNVSVQPTLSEQTVPHAQLQDTGMEKIAFVLKTESGMDSNVYVVPDCMDQTVLHALHQDRGTTIFNSVFVLKTESGTANNVSVHKDFTDLTVLHALHQDRGTTIFNSVFVHSLDNGMDRIALALLQQPSSMVKNVSVQLKPMAPTALRAPHQDSGMETIVFALKKESGTANNVSVHKDFTDLTV